jgi:hypothetical protein
MWIVVGVGLERHVKRQVNGDDANSPAVKRATGEKASLGIQREDVCAEFKNGIVIRDIQAELLLVCARFFVRLDMPESELTCESPVGLRQIKWRPSSSK